MRCKRLDGIKFIRQAPFGPYILDFVCLTAKPVVVIDGPGHDQTVAYDNRRTAFPESEGFRDPRFSNEDVLLVLLERGSGE